MAILEGLELCLVGLFKKIVIADSLGQLVDRVYAAPDEASGGALLLATLAFAGQIYCDFSGYSTIARGLARLLGYRLPVNFHYPLLAANPIEYRRRWHITMGDWFRDYVYRPIGGDRLGAARTVLNTMFVWTAFGLWHGASWHFAAWGFYNGLLLVAYRWLKLNQVLPSEGWLSTALGRVVTPLFLAISVTFFRAADVSEALMIINRIASWTRGSVAVGALWGLVLAALYATHWLSYFYYREGLLARLAWAPRLLLLTAVLAALVFGAESGRAFIYFQF